MILVARGLKKVTGALLEVSAKTRRRWEAAGVLWAAGRAAGQAVGGTGATTHAR